MADNSTSDNIRLSQIVDSGLNIYGSREKIRANLVELAKSYLNISGDSDISKASFMAYIIDMLSVLSSNQVYYQSKIYNEFFLVSANLNESVQNLAKWIGYKIPKAVCATVDVMFTVPLTFTMSYVNFSFPKYFKTYAGDIAYTIKSNDNFSDDSLEVAHFYLNKEMLANVSAGKIVNNSTITVRDYNGFYRPIYVSKDKTTCSFTLKFEQCEYEIQTFFIPEDLQLNQFFNKNLTFKGQVADIQVWVCSPTSGQRLSLNSQQMENVSKIQTFNPTEPIIDSSGQVCKFVQWTETENGVYTIGSTSKQFDWLGYYNRGIISFGNGILGAQPTPGSYVVCILKLTEGSTGNVINQTITSGDTLELQTDYNSTSSIKYSCVNNNAAFGGLDILTTAETKDKAIKNLKIKERLVTDDDYDNITDVVTDTTLNECVPILKRSDIRVNDITLYFILNYYNEQVNNIVPTRNVCLNFVEPTFDENNQLVINKNYRTHIGKEKIPFVTVFNTIVDKTTRMASYKYVCSNVQGVASELYTQSVYDTLNRSLYINCTTTDFSVLFNGSQITNTRYPLNVRVNLSNVPNKVRTEFADLNYQWKVKDFAMQNNKVNNFEITHFKAFMTTKWGEYDIYNDESDGYLEDVTTSESEEDGVSYTTKTYNSITWKIPNYLIVPDGKQRFEFQILCWAPKTNERGDIMAISSETCKEIIGVNADGTMGEFASVQDEIVMQWRQVKQYYSDVIISQNLSDCMQSSVIVDNYLNGIPQGKKTNGEDVQVYHVYEVPTIYEDYYNEVMNKKNSDFELSVMQKLLESLSFSDKRMMTDFTNIKFADCYGPMTNLRYNKADYIVESRYSHTPWWNNQQKSDTMTNVPFPSDIAIENPEYIPPTEIQNGVTYIINGKLDQLGESTPVSDYMGYIAIRIATIPENGPVIYSYSIIKPKLGCIAKIKDELDTSGNMQTCYWTGHEWKSVEDYSIPLVVSLRVQVDEDKVSTSDDAIKEKIIKTLSEYYNDSEKMGLQKSIDRSEIVRVCRSVEGVQYVEVLNPEFDIKFEYTVDDLSQKELLQFTPQYVGFRTITDTNTRFEDVTIDVEIVRK